MLNNQSINISNYGTFLGLIVLVLYRNENKNNKGVLCQLIQTKNLKNNDWGLVNNLIESAFTGKSLQRERKN